jgi:predicted MPP superfamily phosphohydrolase
MKKPKIGIAVYDLHYPEHFKYLWENIFTLTTELKPDYFILGGDNMDMQSLSHWIHDKGESRKLEGKRVKKDYDDFNRDIIDPLNAILKPTCEKHFLEGNHEEWAEQYIDRNPQSEGFYEVRNNLNIKDWKHYRYGEICKIGKMYFIHGTYTNDAHAKKHVNTYEHNIFYGHMHDHQIYTKVTPIDNDTHMGMSIPCCCTTNPDYAKHKPNRWVNGFLIFYVYENEFFQPFPIISVDGKFLFNNVLYK